MEGVKYDLVSNEELITMLADTIPDYGEQEDDYNDILDEMLKRMTYSKSDVKHWQGKYNHTMKLVNRLAQMIHDNALMYQSLLDHDAQGKINPYSEMERWINFIFDEDFL